MIYDHDNSPLSWQEWMTSIVVVLVFSIFALDIAIESTYHIPMRTFVCQRYGRWCK